MIRSNMKRLNDTAVSSYYRWNPMAGARNMVEDMKEKGLCLEKEVEPERGRRKVMGNCTTVIT